MGDSLSTVIKIAFAAVLLLVLVHFGSNFINHVTAPPEKNDAEAQKPPRGEPVAVDSTTESVESRNAGLLQNTLILGCIFGVVAWAGRAIVTSLQHRAEMAIIFVLSDHEPRNYDEIDREVRASEIFKKLRFFHASIDDALATLVHDRRVQISNKMYVVPNPCESSD